MLSATSTRWAPWYVIPADRKWFARICVAAVLAHTLIEIDPQFPAVTADRRQDLLVVKGELEAQAPKGAPADPFAAKKAKKEAMAQASKKAEASQVDEDGHRPDESPGQPARASRARGGAATQGQPAQVNPRTGRSRAKGQPS